MGSQSERVTAVMLKWAVRPCAIRPQWLFEFASRIQPLMDPAMSALDARLGLNGLVRPESRCERLLVRLARWRIHRRDSNAHPGLDSTAHSAYREWREEVHRSSRTRAVAAATEMLDKEPARHWTLGELAQLVGSNRTDLEAGFQSFTGGTYHDYLSMVRIDAARQLLRTTGWSGEAIARAVGYSARTSLYLNFRKYLGITPDEYRRRWISVRANRHVAELIVSLGSGRF